MKGGRRTNRHDAPLPSSAAWGVDDDESWCRRRRRPTCLPRVLWVLRVPPDHVDRLVWCLPMCACRCGILNDVEWGIRSALLGSCFFFFFFGGAAVVRSLLPSGTFSECRECVLGSRSLRFLRRKVGRGERKKIRKIKGENVKVGDSEMASLRASRVATVTTNGGSSSSSRCAPQSGEEEEERI